MTDIFDILDRHFADTPLRLCDYGSWDNVPLGAIFVSNYTGPSRRGDTMIKIDIVSDTYPRGQWSNYDVSKSQITSYTIIGDLPIKYWTGWDLYGIILL